MLVLTKNAYYWDKQLFGSMATLRKPHSADR